MRASIALGLLTENDEYSARSKLVQLGDRYDGWFACTRALVLRDRMK